MTGKMPTRKGDFTSQSNMINPLPCLNYYMNPTLLSKCPIFNDYTGNLLQEVKWLVIQI